MSELWINQNITESQFIQCKQRILDNYSQTWHGEINSSTRLSTYCLFKHSLSLESYLDKINEPKYKIALSRFRLSSHNLEIERGDTIILKEKTVIANYVI